MKNRMVLKKKVKSFKEFTNSCLRRRLNTLMSIARFKTSSTVLLTLMKVFQITWKEETKSSWQMLTPNILDNRIWENHRRVSNWFSPKLMCIKDGSLRLWNKTMNFSKTWKTSKRGRPQSQNQGQSLPHSSSTTFLNHLTRKAPLSWALISKTPINLLNKSTNSLNCQPSIESIFSTDSWGMKQQIWSEMRTNWPRVYLILTIWEIKNSIEKCKGFENIETSY